MKNHIKNLEFFIFPINLESPFEIFPTILKIFPEVKA